MKAWVGVAACAGLEAAFGTRFLAEGAIGWATFAFSVAAACVVTLVYYFWREMK